MEAGQDAPLLATKLPEEPPRRRPGFNKYALVAAVLASTTSIIMGYLVAVMSGAQLYMKADLGLSDTQLEVLSGSINIYSLIGSLAAGWTSDLIGRRLTVILTAAIFLAGSLLTGFAPGYALLTAGRLVCGVGVGYALVVAPVYASEIAPASSRGLLASLPELSINSGILISYVVNLVLAPYWRPMFYAAAVPPVFIAAAVLSLPESPRWLVMRGRIDDARQVLDKTSDTPDEAELRLSEIKAAVQSPARSGRGGGWREVLNPAVRRVVLTVLAIQFFQQASGIDSIVLYSPRVFGKAGLTSDSALLGATIGVGVSKAGFILVAIFLSDKVGRRPLLLASAGGMAVSLLALGVALAVFDLVPGSASGSAGPAVCIAAVVAFVGFFSIGMGPLAWVYSSEILPIQVRAQGASLGTAMNRILSGVVTMTFISLYEAITMAGTFFLYAVIVVACWVFFYFCLPETRGVSLEDMEVLFAK